MKVPFSLAQRSHTCSLAEHRMHLIDGPKIRFFCSAVICSSNRNLLLDRNDDDEMIGANCIAANFATRFTTGFRFRSHSVAHTHQRHNLHCSEISMEEKKPPAKKKVENKIKGTCCRRCSHGLSAIFFCKRFIKNCFYTFSVGIGRAWFCRRSATQSVALSHSLLAIFYSFRSVLLHIIWTISIQCYDCFYVVKMA